MHANGTIAPVNDPGKIVQEENPQVVLLPPNAEPLGSFQPRGSSYSRICSTAADIAPPSGCNIVITSAEGKRPAQRTNKSPSATDRLFIHWLIQAMA